MVIDSATVCCQPDLWVTDGTPAGTVQIGLERRLSVAPAAELPPSGVRQFGGDVDGYRKPRHRAPRLWTPLRMLSHPGHRSGPGRGRLVWQHNRGNGRFHTLSSRAIPNSGLQLWRSDGTLIGNDAGEERTRTGTPVQQPLAGQSGDACRQPGHLFTENAQDWAAALEFRRHRAGNRAARPPHRCRAPSWSIPSVWPGPMAITRYIQARTTGSSLPMERQRVLTYSPVRVRLIRSM